MASAIEDKLVAFGLIGVSYSVVGAVALPFTGLPWSTAVFYALVSAALHVGYNISLLHSYRLGDFGHTYPLARGTSPLLVTAGAWLFAHEHLDGLQLAGIVTVALGLMTLVFAGGRITRADLPATAAAVLTGVAIASYTVVDGLGVRDAPHNSFGYTGLLFLLQGPVLAFVAGTVRRGDLTAALANRADVVAGLGAGVLSLAAYGIVIWAQTQVPTRLDLGVAGDERDQRRGHRRHWSSMAFGGGASCRRRRSWRASSSSTCDASLESSYD